MKALRSLILLLALLLAGPASAKPTDERLYREVAARVASGESYYSAATALQRRDNYPLHPFITVRPPTLAHYIAAVGPLAALASLALLTLTAALAWFQRQDLGRVERYGAAVMICFTTAPTLNLSNVYEHEVWAGVLITLALALPARIALIPAVAAVLIRDIAVLYLAAVATKALLARDRALLPWLAAAFVAIAAFYGLHAYMVGQYVTTADPPSPGWWGLRGALAPASDMQTLSWLSGLPLSIAAVVVGLSFAGWFALRRAIPLLWFGGYLAFLMIVPRADNDYWVALILPGFLVGLVFLPRLLRRGFGNEPRPHRV